MILIRPCIPVFRWDTGTTYLYNIRVRRLPLCRISHSYALLRRIALSSMVYRSFCRSDSRA